MDGEPHQEQETEREEVGEPPADGAEHVSKGSILHDNIEKEIDALQNATDAHFGIHRGPTDDEDEHMDQFDHAVDSIDTEWRPRRGARARNFSDKALENIVNQGTAKVYYIHNNTKAHNNTIPISQVPFVPQKYHYLLDPKNDKEMNSSPDREFWVEADSEEMAQIVKNKLLHSFHRKKGNE